MRWRPVTAKLSKRFYNTFGDEIANDLVEWFNQVDASYRQEPREQDDLTGPGWRLGSTACRPRCARSSTRS